MLDINLNLYKTFYVVAQSKSYSDASNKLYVSVQAISKNILQLERQLDTQLFYRENDGVKLTRAGSELFKYVDKSLTELGLGERLFLHNNMENGEVIIGCPSHISTFYLMDYIEKVKVDYPNLKIKIVSGANAKELIEMLEDHKIDFILDATQFETSYNNIEIKKIKEISNIFVINKNLKIKNIKELENLKFILPYEYTSTTKNLIECLKENDVYIKTSMEIDITELRINAAKRGIGVAYVMKDSVKNELDNNELFEVKVPIDLPTSDLNLIYLKGNLTKINKEFINKYLLAN